jgi:sterol desaturase/sphingolipid hydroxylase (fatty acid hydroxylase superfamily)
VRELLENEPLIRLSIFAGVLLLMALLEALFPRRARRLDRLMRWPANFMIVLINTLTVRLIFPTAAVGFALLMGERQIGLFNHLHLPFPVIVIASMALLDLAIYAQHIVFHQMPLLWRFHRMHHTDLDLDVTSGARFHPVEILLSVMIKFVVIALIGAPAVAVLLFEVLLNAGAMFNHANLRLPERLDRALRVLIVTPDMHRVHHSIVPAETKANFGFNLSCWDRIFGTYVAQPQGGHIGMTIGLAEFQGRAVQRIDNMLLQPWKKTEP